MRFSRRTLLKAASAVLGGIGAPMVARAQAADDTGQSLQVDTEVLYYKENAGRVQAIEPVVSLKKDFGDLRVVLRAAGAMQRACAAAVVLTAQEPRQHFVP